MADMKCKAIGIIEGVGVWQTLCHFPHGDLARAGENPAAYVQTVMDAARRVLEMTHPGCEVFFSSIVLEDEDWAFAPDITARIVANTPPAAD